MMDKIICGDCLDVMKNIPSGSVDMILCDLPYGTVSCDWDVVIPFEPLWEQYKRVIKRNGAIVLTASQPFTTELIHSNLRWFKYCWYWKKNRVGNFINAKHQPLRILEDIPVFYSNPPTYNPQGVTEVQWEMSQSNRKPDENSAYHAIQNGGICKDYVQTLTGYPNQILEFASVNVAEHPTQKPVALFAYLIRTYTNEGELVLDNCIGSGTTAVACVQTGRHYIGIEQSREYCDIAERRVLSARQQLTLELK